jgi:hypothetical protein
MPTFVRNAIGSRSVDTGMAFVYLSLSAFKSSIIVAFLDRCLDVSLGAESIGGDRNQIPEYQIDGIGFEQTTVDLLRAWLDGILPHADATTHRLAWGNRERTRQI